MRFRQKPVGTTLRYGRNHHGLPDVVGGDGATLVDLTWSPRRSAAHLAPVPWIDHVCAARLLARLGALAGEDASGIVQGTTLVALDPQQVAPSGLRLIPAGSIAGQIIIRDGDDIVKLSFSSPPAKVDNIAELPMAWVDPAAADSRVVLAGGAEALAEYQRALDEWRLLTRRRWSDWSRRP